jgi:glutamine phosphoribosylpyrophosphate amidotransferase
MYACVNPGCRLYSTLEKPDPLTCPTCGWTLVMQSTETRRDQPKIPDRLQIGHVRYVIRHDTAWVNAKSLENKHHYAGLSSGGDGYIGLLEDLHPDFEAETLLHEILHQCLRVTTTDPDADAKAGLDDVEERAVAAIAGPLLATLRDNPELVAYLLHRRNP